MHSCSADTPPRSLLMAEQTIRNRTQHRRLMANRTIGALLIVDDARYRLRLN